MPSEASGVTGAAKPRREKAAGKVKAVKPPKTSKPPKAGGKRFIFIVGDEGCILVFMQASKVIRRLFAPSAQPSHTEAMRELMKANPSVPIYLLADVLDQVYRQHPFPPVSSLSIGGLVKRRLDRDFNPEDLKGALPLGRDKTGRKEWKYLLIALTKSPLITEWLDLIVEQPNEMKGVFLVPVEAVAYVSQLNRALGNAEPKPWQLFISHNKISGFRQVVTQDGRLVFTRVSQAIDDAIPAVIAGNIEQEIINTIEYLKRLDFKDNADLDTTVVISQDVIDSLDLNRFGFARAQTLTPIQVSEALGLEQAALTADRFGDVVMACAFGISKKRILRFSTAYLDKLNKIYQARVGIRAVAALAVVGLLGMSAMSALNIVNNFSAIDKAKKEAAAQEPELMKFQSSVTGLNDNIAFKSALMASYDAFIKDAPKHEDAVRALMKLLSTDLRMVSIEWKAKDTSTAPGQAPAAGDAAMPVEIKIEVDFSGAGKTSDELTKAAKAFMEKAKTQLPYEITSEPYRWDAQQDKSTNVGLELTQASTISPENMIATFMLHGPKKGQAQP